MASCSLTLLAQVMSLHCMLPTQHQAAKKLRKKMGNDYHLHHKHQLIQGHTYFVMFYLNYIIQDVKTVKNCQGHSSDNERQDRITNYSKTLGK